jgi:hypothetical protein
MLLLMRYPLPMGVRTRGLDIVAGLRREAPKRCRRSRASPLYAHLGEARAVFRISQVPALVV